MDHESIHDDHNNSSESRYGKCPNCGGIGSLGQYCDDCGSDTGLGYFDRISDENDDHTSTARESLQELISRRQSYVDESESSELIEFFTAVSCWCDIPEEDAETLGGWIVDDLEKDHGSLYQTVRDIMRDILVFDTSVLSQWATQHNIHARTFTNNFKNTIAHVGAEWLYLQTPPTHLETHEEMVIRERNRNQIAEETAFPNTDTNIKNPKHQFKYNNLWIGDSGASCHMTNTLDGMFDCTEIHSYVKIGNGTHLRAYKKGKKRLTITQVDGSTSDIILHDCQFVPDLWINLISIPICLQNHWNISNEGNTILLRKHNSCIKFDQTMNTTTGIIMAVHMRARSTHMDVPTEDFVFGIPIAPVSPFLSSGEISPISSSEETSPLSSTGELTYL